MDIDSCPWQIKEFILEMIRRKAFSHESINDKTLLNHLSTQKLDSDYIKRSVKY